MRVLGLAVLILSFTCSAAAVDVVCDIPRGDSAGWSVAGGGDVDGDGTDDIVVGAPCAYIDGLIKVGRVFVYSGADRSRIILLKGSHDSQNFGSAVAILPDVDDDGRDEIVVGSSGYNVDIGNNQFRDSAGKVEVYDADGNVLSFSEGQSVGATYGETVSSVADLTGDGIADLMVGAGGDRIGGVKKGRAFLVSGSDGSIVDVSDGQYLADSWGSTLARGVDVNGDLVEDVLVASNLADRPLEPGNPESPLEENNGRIAVLSGADLSTELLSIYGGVEERLGRSVVTAGDLGLLCGASGTTVNAKNKAGTVTLVGWDGSVGLVLAEPQPQVSAAFGTAVAHLGDVDESMVSSIAASAPNALVDGSNRAGRVHAMRGDDGSLHWTMNGWSTDLRLGQSLVGDVDVNGDGILDVLIGAPGDSPRGRRGAGSVLAVSGDSGEELFRVSGRRGIETVVYAAGWRYGRVPHVRSFNHRARRREVKRDAYRRLIDGTLSIAVMDEFDLPDPGTMKLVLGTGHGADDDEIQVVYAGRRGRVVSRFDAFGPNYTGGVNVGAGDVRGESDEEIIAVQAGSPGGQVSLRIYGRVDEDLLGNIIWLQIASFDAFNTGEVIQPGSIPLIADGANIAIGDVDSDGNEEIVAGPVKGTPAVRVLGGAGARIAEWMAYFSGENGINVAVGDLDDDGTNEIVTGPGSGLPRIRVFEGDGTPFENPDTSTVVSFFAFDMSMTAGVRVAVADVDLDGRGEIIAATGDGVTTEMRAFEMDGTLVPGWESVRPMGPNSDRGIVMATTDHFLRH